MSEYGCSAKSCVSEVRVLVEGRIREVCASPTGKRAAIESCLSTELDLGEEWDCTEISIGEEGVFRKVSASPVRNISESTSRKVYARIEVDSSEVKKTF